jgi:hypothetical protein
LHRLFQVLLPEEGPLEETQTGHLGLPDKEIEEEQQEARGTQAVAVVQEP